MARVEAFATLAVTEGVTATATLQVDPGTVAWEQYATLSVDGTVSGIALPSSPLTKQKAGVRIYVGGVLVPHSQLCGPWKVTRSRRSAVQQGEFTVRLANWGQSPFGDPFSTLGSPTGKKAVSFYGVYRYGGVTVEYPLLVDGVVDNVVRNSSPQGGGHTETYTVLDKGGIYSKRVLVTLVTLPGSNIPRGRLVKKAFLQAGETSFALEDGGPCNKEWQLIDANPVSACQELVDVEGRIIRWDRRGQLVNPLLFPPSTQPSQQTIDEKSILATTTVAVHFPQDAITEVTATGTEQIVSEDDLCGEVPKESSVTATKTFAPFVATYVQNADSTLTTLTVPLGGYPARDQRFSFVLNRVVTRCGITVREESETWQFYDPEAARYYWDPGFSAWKAMKNTGPLSAQPVYIGSDGTPGGSEKAYIRNRDAWSMVARTVTRRFYDADGYGASTPYDGGHFAPGQFLGVFTGKYLGSLTVNESFYNPRAAMKDRGAHGAALSFDTLDPRDLVQKTGSGEAVKDGQETFQVTSVTAELVFSNNDTGFIESVQQLEYGWGVRPDGEGRYQYGDGSLSDDSEEFFPLHLGSTITSYLPGEENQHSEAVLVDKLGESPTSTLTSGISGAGPAVDYLPGYEPYNATELTEEEAAFATHANAGETRAIKVTYSAPDLLNTHWPSVRKVNYPYAENLTELANAAADVIRESLVVKANITLPADYLVSEGDVLTVTHRPSGLGVSRRVVIDEITWSGAPLQPTLTDVSLDLYPDG